MVWLAGCTNCAAFARKPKPTKARAKIKEAYSSLGSFRQVGRNFNISHQAVDYIVTNDYDRPKKKRGPKFSLSRSQELAIKREVCQANLDGRRVTAASAQAACDLGGMSTEGARLNMARLGFHHRTIQQSIVLTKTHKLKRLALAKEWLKDSHPWPITIFTDEKKFNLDGPDSWSTYTDEKRELCRTKRQMGGCSVMVWAMLLPNQTIHIRRLHGRVDSAWYIELLSSIEPILDNIYGRSGFVYLQDNAPIHTALKVRKFFADQEWTVMDWPARSPDLNIIENVWHMLSHIVYANKQYESAEALWTAIQNAAETIMMEKRAQLDNLYSDITQRLIEVVEAKGATIKR